MKQKPKQKQQIIEVEDYAWYPFHIQTRNVAPTENLVLSRWLWTFKPIGRPLWKTILFWAMQIITTPALFAIDLIFITLIFNLLLKPFIDFVFDSSKITLKSILKPIEKGLSALFFIVGIALAIFIIYQTFKLDMW